MDEKELNSSMRKKYEPALKTRVAIEAIKGTRTAAEIAREFEVPSSLVSLWKKSALAMVPEVSPERAKKLFGSGMRAGMNSIGISRLQAKQSEPCKSLSFFTCEARFFRATCSQI